MPDTPPHPRGRLPPPLTLAEARKVFPPIWVVYERPRDFPTGYVVRVWWGLTPESHGYSFETLARARDFIQLQGGSARMRPGRGDPPHICETWL